MVIYKVNYFYGLLQHFLQNINVKLTIVCTNKKDIYHQNNLIKMISIGDTLLHYKRPEIQKEIVESAKHREIATQFKDGFGLRPDTLSYPQDILALTKAGATSFHMSEERWSNALRLNPKLKKR